MSFVVYLPNKIFNIIKMFLLKIGTRPIIIITINEDDIDVRLCAIRLVDILGISMLSKSVYIGKVLIKL